MEAIADGYDCGVRNCGLHVGFVAIRNDLAADFTFPTEIMHTSQVKEILGDLMGANGWIGVKQWIEQANDIAPTIVGSSKNMVGTIAGPTRGKTCMGCFGS